MLMILLILLYLIGKANKKQSIRGQCVVILTRIPVQVNFWPHVEYHLKFQSIILFKVEYQ